MLNHHRLNHRFHRRQGAALVEAAIILPVFLILIGIAVDYSRVMYSSVTLSGTARNGALYDFDPVNTTESNYTSCSNCACADGTNISNNLSISESTSTTNGTTDVTVTANTNFRTLSSWLILPSSQSVNRSIVVRKAQLIPDPPP